MDCEEIVDDQDVVWDESYDECILHLLFDDYLRGALTPPQKDLIEEHIENCEDGQALLEEFRLKVRPFQLQLRC